MSLNTSLVSSKPYTSIPPHGRWQHFNVGGRQRLEQLIQSWGNIDTQEKSRRLLDLFLISVLLDAGAGNVWKFTTVGAVVRAVVATPLMSETVPSTTLLSEVTDP